jgi:hypothetical protein
MEQEAKITLIQQVMGASHVFCSAVTSLLERTLAEASDVQLVIAGEAAAADRGRSSGSR